MPTHKYDFKCLFCAHEFVKEMSYADYDKWLAHDTGGEVGCPKCFKGSMVRIWKDIGSQVNGIKKGEYNSTCDLKRTVTK